MMSGKHHAMTRRKFLCTCVAAPSLFHIVPRHVLGGPGQIPPSETFGAALIGVGGRGPSTFRSLCDKHELNVVKLAECDVKWVGKTDNKTRYTDFRRVLERKDIDIVAIATPPHWHALISIAAMEAGKDVLCEKPMTRFIGEGRAVVEAARRYNRVFQIGTYGRFGAEGERERHKMMTSGLIKKCTTVYYRRGGFKVRQWSGRLDLPSQPAPKHLDWDMYCGPSPLKPYVRTRVGGTHRWYWDYEGGGLADMGQHHLDRFQWVYGKDYTSPIEIEACAPPAHPEVTGMWAWVKMTYADGLTVLLESGEWGKPYEGVKSHRMGLDELDENTQNKIRAMPDPEPLLSFGDAVKTRQQAGGHPEAAHRCATLLHLANLAIRAGRKIHYDPVKERIMGDEDANRLVNPPMRAPWHV